jgi:aryl-alcohol dehydrogenase-like predicted oxidoreductase
MPTPSRYGTTDLFINPLGLGAAQIGDTTLDDAQVGRLLNTAVDAGINLFDTAPSYGISEERIGRHLATRRRELILSTKLGYGVSGIPDWTGPCITAGVEQACACCAPTPGHCPFPLLPARGAGAVRRSTP